MAVDWWAFGVFLYEMMAGFPPFYDEDVTNTYKKILSGRFGFPAHFSVNARDLIRKLLQVQKCLLTLLQDPRISAGFSEPQLNFYIRGYPCSCRLCLAPAVGLSSKGTMQRAGSG